MNEQPKIVWYPNPNILKWISDNFDKIKLSEEERKEFSFKKFEINPTRN